MRRKNQCRYPKGSCGFASFPFRLQSQFDQIKPLSASHFGSAFLLIESPNRVAFLRIAAGSLELFRDGSQRVRFRRLYQLAIGLHRNHARFDGFEAKVLIDGEEKQLASWRGGLVIELAAPFPAYVQPDEFSRLRIPRPGREGFRDPVGQGRRLRSRPQGDWERTLRAWQPAIPFE
jgi:hypothetical protein